MSNRFIPDSVIDDIRKHFDIVDVVGQHVKLKRSGRNYFGLCPFHSEKSPSFSVAPDKQIYYCFGCGAGGNVINFVMNIEGYEFVDAIKHLANEAGIALPEIAGSSPAVAEDEETVKMREAHDLAAKLYHYILTETTQGREAMTYLTERGFTRDEIVTFQIGYAPDSYETLFSFLNKRGYKNDLLVACGLASENDEGRVYDRFRNRIIFPINDLQGRVVGLGGRIIGSGEPKYLNSPESKIFNKGKMLYNLNLAKKSIRKGNRAILFEGYIDTIAAYRAGVEYGVASLGTALTNQQALLLKRFADQVYICYDSDNAGKLATLRAIEVLTKNGLKTMIATLPTGQDPDDYIKEHGAESFNNEIIGQAVSTTTFRLTQARGAYNLKNESGRLDYIKQALTIIAELNHAVEQEHYLQELAGEFKISLDSLKRDFQRVRKQQDNRVGTPIGERGRYEIGATSKQQVLYPAYYNAERNLIYLMMRSAEISRRVELELGAGFHMEEFATLAASIYSYYEQGYQAEVDRFIAYLEDEDLRQLATKIAMGDINEEITEQELNDYLRKIKDHGIQQEIEKKRAAQLKAERNNEIEESLRLGQEIIELRNKKRDK